MAHGRQKSAPKRLTELPRYHRLCCCSWAAFHAVNYYYRRVSVHLSGHSSLAATHPTTCNKTALRHRHRQAPKHTHTDRESERDRNSDRDVWFVWNVTRPNSQTVHGGILCQIALPNLTTPCYVPLHPCTSSSLSHPCPLLIWLHAFVVLSSL